MKIAINPLIRKANYYETDQMGIIHHSNYIRWFEEARVDFMEQVGFGYSESVLKGIDFALTGLSCEYKSMVRFGETVAVNASITELTNSRMHVSYEVRDAESGELRTTGETRHCFFDSERKRPVSLKKKLPELYELFLGTMGEEA
jgi:acyl-CoA thioester hydrolase